MKKLSIIFSMLVVFAITVSAQNFAKKGCFEIGGDIGFSSQTPVSNGNTGDASTSFSLSSYTGYFIIDGFEIGFAPLSYTIYTPPSGSKYSTLSILAAPAYNFDLKSNIFPFIEGLFGYTAQTVGDNSASGFSYGARGGIKIILGENALINAGIQYMLYTYNPEGADNRYGYNLLMINAGFAVYFN
ncbi:MAG: porin family protein [Candidatus Cloacimonetes bacterium]|nr:porin family protein [Candidatus Cloacimonadota bacterium]